MGSNSESGSWAQRNPVLFRSLQGITAVLVAVLVLTECTGDDSPKRVATPKAAHKSTQAKLSADQSKLIDELRTVWNWNGICVDGMTAARETFDSSGQNEAALLDGYDKLKAAIPNCEGFGRDAAEFRFSAFSKPLDVEKSQHALDSCRIVAPNAAKAMQAAVRWLDDGGGELARASEIRRGLESATGDHGMCGAALNDLAESYGIPASEGRFYVSG